MLDIEQIKILAQLMDNAEATVETLEKSYEKNNAEEFTNSKKEILDIQNKIANILK
ncbi:hypothetical protein HOE04_00865 [archaeon]|jgi:hypothetical protein|nr:hypothetical protein [archaeon]